MPLLLPGDIKSCRQFKKFKGDPVRSHQRVLLFSRYARSDYSPTRRLVRSETDNIPPPSRCIVALQYININIYIMCTREPKRFFLFYPSVNVVFFFVGLFIYLFWHRETQIQMAQPTVMPCKISAYCSY